MLYKLYNKIWIQNSYLENVLPKVIENRKVINLNKIRLVVSIAMYISINNDLVSLSWQNGRLPKK